MNIHNTRNSLLRARNIRAARRNRSGRILSSRTNNGSLASKTSSKNTASYLNSASSTVNANKISAYEGIEKSAANIQKTVEDMLTIGKMTYSDDKAGEEAKEKAQKNLISGIKTFVSEYNAVYSGLGKLAGATNLLFRNQISDIISSNASELKAIGISVSRSGEITVDESKLREADFDKLRNIFTKENGFADKVSRKMEVIEKTAASAIASMDKLYGANSTYTKYGTNDLYGSNYYNSYGNTSSWYF